MKPTSRLYLVLYFPAVEKSTVRYQEREAIVAGGALRTAHASHITPYFTRLRYTDILTTTIIGGYNQLENDYSQSSFCRMEMLYYGTPFLPRMPRVQPRKCFKITPQTLQAHPGYPWGVWESIDESVPRENIA